MGDALIALEHLQKSFGETHVLDDLCLDIRHGEFLTLLGPSGCGKTTTLRILAGLLSPDQGRVWINGQDVTDLPANRRSVNTVFQNYALFPHMNVEKNIAYGLRMRGLRATERRAKVREMLELIRMPGFEKRMPSELSGGQRQRVAIARAAVLQPNALLLDEPLGALDLNLRKQMQIELKKLQETLGIAFLYITHDQEEALNMSDRVAILNNGRLEQLGTPEEIYERPKTLFAARFIGEGSLIPGVAAEAEGGVRAIDLPIGRALARDCQGCVPGTSVTLCVRSERIQLGKTPVPGFDISGTVLRRRYAGSALRTEVQLRDGTQIIAQSPAAMENAIASGDAVYISWQPLGAALLTEVEP